MQVTKAGRRKYPAAGPIPSKAFANHRALSGILPLSPGGGAASEIG